MNKPRVIVVIHAPTPSPSPDASESDYNIVSTMKNDTLPCTLPPLVNESHDNGSKLPRMDTWRLIVSENEEKLVNGSASVPLESPIRSQPPVRPPPPTQLTETSYSSRPPRCPRRDSMRLMRRFTSMFVESDGDSPTSTEAPPIQKLPTQSLDKLEEPVEGVLDNELLKNEMVVLDPRSRQISDSELNLQTQSHALEWLSLPKTPRRRANSDSKTVLVEEKEPVESKDQPMGAIMPYDTYDNLTAVSPSTNPIKEISNIQAESYSSLSDLLPESVKCGICNNILKEPHVLNCLHSFCLHCLASLEPITVIKSSHLRRKCSLSPKGNRSPLTASTPLSPTTRRGSVALKAIEPTTTTKPNPETQILGRPRRRSADRPQPRNNEAEKFKRIACPTCGTTTELPSGGYCRLPKNFPLVRKIDEAISTAGVQQVARNWCFLCTTKTIASAYCIECTINLCTLCGESHRRQRTTSEHTIKWFMETHSPLSSTVTPMPTATYKCPIHISNELVIFCVNCQQVLCNDCTILVHRGHKTVAITKAARVYEKLLLEHVERIQPAVEALSTSKHSINECSKEIDQVCEKVENDVEEFFNEYFATLERHKQSLLEQIKHVRSKRMESVLTVKVELDKRSEEVDQVVAYTDDLLKTGNEIEMLSLVRLLRKRFESCQKLVNTSTNFKIPNSLRFLSDTKSSTTSAQSRITTFGVLSTEEVDAKLSSLEPVEDLQNLKLHKNIRLTFITRNTNNQRLQLGGIKVTVDLNYTEADDVLPLCHPVPVNVLDNQNGSYEIRFTLEWEGVLLMNIFVEGVLAKDNSISLKTEGVPEGCSLTISPPIVCSHGPGDRDSRI